MELIVFDLDGTLLEGHQFLLPQAYKNGVMIWHPEQSRFSSGAMLTADELDHIVQACIRQAVTPFVFTLEDDHVHIERIISKGRISYRIQGKYPTSL